MFISHTKGIWAHTWVCAALVEQNALAQKKRASLPLLNRIQPRNGSRLCLARSCIWSTYNQANISACVEVEIMVLEHTSGCMDMHLKTENLPLRLSSFQEPRPRPHYLQHRRQHLSQHQHRHQHR